MLSMMDKLPKEWDSIIEIVTCLVVRYQIPLRLSPARLETPMYETARSSILKVPNMSQMRIKVTKMITEEYEIGRRRS